MSVNICIIYVAIIVLIRHVSFYVPQLFQEYPKENAAGKLQLTADTFQYDRLTKKLYLCKIRLHTLILVEGVQSVRSCTRAGKILEKFRLTNVRQPRFNRSCSIGKYIIAFSKWLFWKLKTGTVLNMPTPTQNTLRLSGHQNRVKKIH